MKKVIIIVGSVLGILAILAGVYFAWKKTKAILTPPGLSQPAVSSQPPATTGQEAAQTVATQKLKILSDQPIFDYFVRPSFSDGRLSTSSEIFYLGQDGKIFKVEGDKSEAVSSEPIENLQAIKSSFDGKRVIIKYGDFVSPKFIIFNSEASIFELLPENISAAALSPDAAKIAYMEKSSGNLMVKDLVGTKPKTTKILTIFQKDFDLEWILPEKIILTPKPSALYAALAWVVDTKNKTLTPLGIETNSLMIKWSTNGKMGLKFSGGLTLIDEKGATRATLDFITLPDKCFISEPKIYCAIPENIPAKTVLPDDYLKRAVYFKDIFYQIDINQNSFSEILAGGETALDATHLNLVDNKLLFINRYDNGLYSLEL